MQTDRNDTLQSATKEEVGDQFLECREREGFCWGEIMNCGNSRLYKQPSSKSHKVSMMIPARRQQGVSLVAALTCCCFVLALSGHSQQQIRLGDDESDKILSDYTRNCCKICLVSNLSPSLLVLVAPTSEANVIRISQAPLLSRQRNAGRLPNLENIETSNETQNLPTRSSPRGT
mmetsp:Transcript_34502/g.83686  ORF Transcript_34502/g.83686 Transcript_34502/m.83686 type:complete len:175 (+) Transcript_34502:181-705(+)